MSAEAWASALHDHTRGVSDGYSDAVGGLENARDAIHALLARAYAIGLKARGAMADELGEDEDTPREMDRIDDALESVASAFDALHVLADARIYGGPDACVSRTVELGLAMDLGALGVECGDTLPGKRAA